MAVIHSISGPRISAVPDPRYANPEYLASLGDRINNGALIQENGDFLGIRVDVARDDKKLGIMWDPVSAADCVFDETGPNGGTFTVFGGILDPRVAQWFLGHLTREEKRELMLDLKNT